MTKPAVPSQPTSNEFPIVDDELLAVLPPLLKAVVKALGFGRARELLMEHGGINHNIPQKRSQALGLADDELQRLRKTLAPHMDAAGRVWLPKPDKLFNIVRNAQIRKDRSAKSINVLAKQNHLSSRQIVNICRLDSDERQFDLF